MKTLSYVLFALLIIGAILQGCKKNGGPGSTGNQLVVSKSVVKITEPDSMLFTGGKPADSIRWTVIPAGFDSLITMKNKALVFFKKSGKYKVTASDSGKLVASGFITVTDSVYKPITTYTTIPLTGDQITLVPYYKTGAADSSYLSFVAQTKNYYCSNGTLVVSDSLKNNKFGITFYNVVQPTVCTLGNTPVAAVINFTQGYPQPVPNGNFPLSVTFNGVVYTGSIIITATTVTYNWNYTSGVLISPKIISR